MTPQPSALHRAGALAGQAVAHVFDSWFKHGTFVPLMLTVDDAERIALRRIMAHDGTEMLAMRNGILAAPDVTAAGFVFDGYINLPQGRFEAIWFECIDPADAAMLVRGAVPYVPRRGLHAAKLYRPKITATPPNWTEEQVWQVLDRFWAGIDAQPQVAKRWDHLSDDSI